MQEITTRLPEKTKQAALLGGLSFIFLFRITNREFS